MKSINFKRQESVLRYNEENNGGPKRKRNWDRILYFIILGIVLFLLVRWILLNTVYLEANGQVIFENRNIQTVDDCRILEFKVAEGDEVKKGDTLFMYINDEDEYSALHSGDNSTSFSIGSPGVKKVKSPDWIDREMFNIRKQIALNNGHLMENKKMLKAYNRNIQRMEQEVILDVIPKSKLDDIRLKIESIEADIAQQQQENNFYNQYISELTVLKQQQLEYDQEIQNIELSASGNAHGGNNYLKAFLSPMDGTVSRLYKEPFEVGLKSEVIITIHKPENVKIKAYVSQEDIDNIEIGDEISIIFPDNTESIGRVHKFHATTSRLPEEFQKKYEPTTRSIIVDILPVNTIEAAKWQMYYKLEVTIRKFKL